jgi:hypothetical protein
MPNNRLTLAGMGLPRYVDALYEQGDIKKNYAWLDMRAAKLDADPPEITKKEIYEAMGITSTTLDKYLTLRKIERARQNGD